jgi:hypothetical protein
MKKTAFALTLAAIFCLSLTPVRTDDLFMYLALGRRLAELGGFGSTDPFLFTIPDYHWHLWHEWLSYLLYYFLHRLTGFHGIVIFKAMLTSLGAVLVWKAGSRYKLPPFLSLGITGISLFIGFPRISDRASFFSDLLTCTVLFLLTGDPQAKAGRLPWGLPLAFLLWTQLHPGFPVAWILLGLFTMIGLRDLDPRSRRNQLITLALCISIELLNPLGIEGVVYPLRKFFSPDWDIFRSINSEWQRTLGAPFLPWIHKILVLAQMAITGIFTAMRAFPEGRFRLEKLFPFLATLVLTYLGLSGVRFLALSGMGLGVLLASSLGERQKSLYPPEIRQTLIRAATILIPTAALIASLISDEFGPRILFKEKLIAATVPLEEIRLFQKLPPGNIFNEYDLGGLLAWELNGRMKIAAHGHIDSPDLVMSRYYRFSYSPKDFEEIIIGGNVEYFLARTSTLQQAPNAGYVQELQGPRWRPLFSNERVTIFQRQR